MVKFCARALLLVSCAAVEKAPVQDPNHWKKWGQIHTYGPHWAENERRPVINFTAGLRPPHVLTATLGTEYLPPGPNPEITFRWAIKAGVGGAAREWIIDAKPLQQVSLAADTIEISIFASRAFVDKDFIDPNTTVRASGFLGVGATATERATYTERLNGPTVILPGNSYYFNVPNGASSFRLCGVSPNSPVSNSQSVFKAGVAIVVAGQDGQPVMAYGGPDLVAPMASGDFIPLPGGATSVRVFNATEPGPIGNMAIVWGVDM